MPPTLPLTSYPPSFVLFLSPPSFLSLENELQSLERESRTFDPKIVLLGFFRQLLNRSSGVVYQILKKFTD